MAFTDDFIENEFWSELENEAKNQKLSMSKLILRIDNQRPDNYNNLSSYIGVWILENLKIKIMKFL